MLSNYPPHDSFLICRPDKGHNNVISVEKCSEIWIPLYLICISEQVFLTPKCIWRATSNSFSLSLSMNWSVNSRVQTNPGGPQVWVLPVLLQTSLLRSRSGRSHATLPVLTRPRREGERCVTSARAAAEETICRPNFGFFIAFLFFPFFRIFAIHIDRIFKLEFLGIFRAFLCVCKQKRLNHWYRISKWYMLCKYSYITRAILRREWAHFWRLLLNSGRLHRSQWITQLSS